MNTKYVVFGSILLVACMAGCNTVTTPPSTLNPGSLSAEFPNGAEFLSTGATVSDQSSNYILSATQNISGTPADEISISIPKNPNLTVPYTVTERDGSYTVYLEDASGNQYEANSAQGYCTITVTQISPTFEGNFSAHVICTSIADSVRDLVNGAFNATYQ